VSLSQNANIQEEFERSYWMLAEDGLLLLSASRRAHGELVGSLARAAILNTLVLPEVVANCCLENLALPNSAYNEIDRLSALAKFDFYLRTKFRSKSLDRGNAHVSSLIELKKLRDDYVHPKRRRIAWVGPENGLQAADRPITPLLGIATNPRDWWHEDAAIAVRATHLFFKFFFRDCCRYSRATVSSLLAGGERIPQPGNFYVPALSRSLKADLVRSQIDLGYIRYQWT
jgi:hypothetical protein